MDGGRYGSGKSFRRTFFYNHGPRPAETVSTDTTPWIPSNRRYGLLLSESWPTYVFRTLDLVEPSQKILLSWPYFRVKGHFDERIIESTYISCGR
jgi:hypothetical protein